MVLGMPLGELVRDLRQARLWSQADLAERLCVESGQCTLTRQDISRWETGGTIPRRRWLEHLAQVLEVGTDVLAREASLDRVNRRQFLELSALTAAHGKMAAELVASVAAGDVGPLQTVQTTHGTDLVIAALVDRPSMPRLRRWMRDGASPVLRVNAAGILAKVPDRDTSYDVATCLAGDAEVQQLYRTAVLARTCALDWPAAERLASDPTAAPNASYVAARLAREVLNARDAGARWCSAAMLRDLSPLLG